MSVVRGHIKADGTPKRVFVTEREAMAERDQRCPAKDVYPCNEGAAPRHWHIGGRRRISQIRQQPKDRRLVCPICGMGPYPTDQARLCIDHDVVLVPADDLREADQ